MAIVDADALSLLKRMAEYEAPRVAKWVTAQES
jgi:hypothetical protein